MSIVDGPHDNMAIRLTTAVSRLRARLREEAGITLSGLSVSQLVILKRLRKDGVATASSLAAVEHVSQQAIAQSLAILKQEGLIVAETDPTDCRKSLIKLTDAGLRLIEEIVASRDAWLTRAIDAVIPAVEQADLERAIELLERLADAKI